MGDYEILRRRRLQILATSENEACSCGGTNTSLAAFATRINNDKGGGDRNNRNKEYIQKQNKSGTFPDIMFTPPERPATPPGVPVPYPNSNFTGK